MRILGLSSDYQSLACWFVDSGGGGGGGGGRGGVVVVVTRSYKEKANSNRPIGPYKAVRYLT